MSNRAAVLNIVTRVFPRYQLGTKQRETWATLTVAQQIAANELMSSMTASKALATVKGA